MRAPVEGKDPRVAGFTLIELMSAVVVAAIMLALGYAGFREFNEAITVRKAAGTIAADLSLTRSFAIQRRENVSLVADEADRSYEIRAADGTVLSRRSFDVDSGLPLDGMAVGTVGDSVTFNSRGLMIGGGGVEVAVGRRDRAQVVYMNALGRYTIKKADG